MAATKSKPLRKCIGCGEQKEKNMLIRVIRSPEGDIRLDETGRANGRGAYVCREQSCLEKAVKTHALERSLHTSISKEIYDTLKNSIC